MKTLQKPPKLKRFTAMPRGPHQFQPDGKRIIGPGEPPPGFIMPTNSITEWFVYWALARIFHNPLDPRVGPFFGGWPDWTYQKAVDGGRKEPGGAVIDFVVYTKGPRNRGTALRVVTEYFHLFTSSQKQATDEMQKERISEFMDVIDLYDYTFLSDKTGAAVIKRVKEALGLIEYENVLAAGTALRNR
jgi:hypothetical protein